MISKSISISSIFENPSLLLYPADQKRGSYLVFKMKQFFFILYMFKNYLLIIKRRADKEQEHF